MRPTPSKDNRVDRTHTSSCLSYNIRQIAMASHDDSEPVIDRNSNDTESPYEASKGIKDTLFLERQTLLSLCSHFEHIQRHSH